MNQAADWLPAQLEELDRRRQEAGVPGLQVVVVADDVVLHAGGLGQRGVDDPRPVAAGTLFHHGSCGKAYTALLGAVLAEQGRLDLDRPVRDYLPALRLTDPVVAERVTTRDLLSHRSGIGRHDLVWILNPSFDREDLVARLAHLPLGAEFRTGMEYTNFGYALAGLVMGKVCASSWEQELAARVLGPLGLTGTLTSGAAMERADNRARPHLLRAGRPVETTMRVLDGAAPAGQLITHAEDAARWLAFQLGRPSGSAELDAAVRQTHQLQVGLPADAAGVPELTVYGYGMGWLVGTFRGRPLRWHSGGVDGFLTQTLLLPEQRIGVLLCANQHYSPLPFAAALQLLDAATGHRSEPSWYDRLSTAIPAPAAVTPDPPVEDDRPGAAPGHPLADYVGVFADPGYGQLLVRAAGDGLGVQVGEEAMTTRHRRFETWDLHYPALAMDLTVTFGTDPDGAVVEAALVVDPAAAPVRFRRVPEPS